MVPLKTLKDYADWFTRAAAVLKHDPPGCACHFIRAKRGGKDYLALFCSLTRSCRGKRTVFYNSDV
jgi:hypothetical protein